MGVEVRRLPHRHPDLAAEFERRVVRGELPTNWTDALPELDAKDATRKHSGATIQALAGVLPELIGGSADLAASNNTDVKDGGDFSATDRSGRNLRFGVREHAMASMANGMALHGGVIPYVASFLIFTDYCRPAIRLSALMGQRVIYVMTHDSIGLGEDGPTHQPIEHLAALRAIPGLQVLRPADGTETVGAWRVALEDGRSLGHRAHPSGAAAAGGPAGRRGRPRRVRAARRRPGRRCGRHARTWCCSAPARRSSTASRLRTCWQPTA
jgi:transketolase